MVMTSTANFHTAGPAMVPLAINALKAGWTLIIPASNPCGAPLLGITDIQLGLLSNITVYPNPSKGIFTISNIEDVVSMSVTDALGRIVMDAGMKGQSTYQIDLGREESGIYFIKLSSEQGSVVKKVILESVK
jgi:hypothetical protein